jgi:hypothetical protein
MNSNFFLPRVRYRTDQADFGPALSRLKAFLPQAFWFDALLLMLSVSEELDRFPAYGQNRKTKAAQ